jgi:hypothetical protein
MVFDFLRKYSCLERQDPIANEGKTMNERDRLKNISCIVSALLIFCFDVLPFSCAIAQTESGSSEDVIYSLPPGYKEGFRASSDKRLLLEWIPANETAENWSEMYTTQIFKGPAEKSGISAKSFLNALIAEWGAGCKNASTSRGALTTSNGYEEARIYLVCPNSPVTNKPEHTLVKVIRGNHNMYVFQKAFSFDPSDEQFQQAGKYLDTAKICDMALPDRSCANVIKGQASQ